MGGKQPNREPTEQFALYEDTEFLGAGRSQKAAATPAATNNKRPAKTPERNRSEECAKTDDFGVYQVTAFLSEAERIALIRLDSCSSRLLR